MLCECFEILWWYSAALTLPPSEEIHQQHDALSYTGYSLRGLSTMWGCSIAETLSSLRDTLCRNSQTTLHARTYPYQ